MVDPKNYPIRMEGSYPEDNLFLLAATVEDGLSHLTRTNVEFVCRSQALDLTTLLGTKMRVVLDAPGAPKRMFPGTCVSVEFLGTESGNGHYCAEIRPWLWFLTRTRECRIFQDMTVVEIIHPGPGNAASSRT